MVKKVNQTFHAQLTKNTIVEKGGAWLLEVRISNEGVALLEYSSITAWANASAAKRYIKQLVLEKTPRKSVKMAIAKTDTNDKPLQLIGELVYKVDA